LGKVLDSNICNFLCGYVLMKMTSKSLSFDAAKSKKFLETFGGAHIEIHIFNVNKYDYELSHQT